MSKAHPPKYFRPVFYKGSILGMEPTAPEHPEAVKYVPESLLQEHEETVSTILEALKGAETFLEMFLEDQRHSDAQLAERDGYEEDYASLHTQNIEESLASVRSAIAKAEAK